MSENEIERNKGLSQDEVVEVMSKAGIGSSAKLETALAWISCLQQGKSPIDTLGQMGIEQVIVYGIADLGEKFVYEARRKGYKVLAIVDKRVEQGSYTFDGIPIITISDLQLESYRNEKIVITAMSFWEEIKKDLQSRGVRNILSIRELIEY